MKRIFVFTLLLSFLLPGLKAQSDQNVVAGFTTETVTVDILETPAPAPKKVKSYKAGYQSNLSFNLISNYDDCGRFSIDYIGGVRFNRYFYLGVGIGLCGENGKGEYYIPNNDEKAIHPMVSVPLYLHGRAYMGKKKCQPYFALSTGGYIAFPVYVEGYYDSERYSPSSFFFEPAFGLSFRMKSKRGGFFAMNFELGVNIHNVKYAYDNGGIEYYGEMEPDLSLKFGMTF